MQDPLLDPLRQRILTRMGISSWQLRAPSLLAGHATPAQDESAAPTVTAAPAVVAMPTGKLWLLAPALPAPALLGDICQLLGIDADEVSLLESLPEGLTPPLLWLTSADPRWPDALVCPLQPDAAQKRSLWQQLRQRLPG
ncbi:DNA polymerase III subunit psi [Aeromonas tecta]|uniref:DNA polymerase III subunit psi n=1 Tax=Aeromonas tecta TaxID=324617 RepID=UPI0009F953E2|nr:DNA polymerase III subunit psi [Aeromonas tecta]